MESELKELESWLGKMKKVESATEFTDSCGRTSRTRNVFELDEKYEKDFLAFVKKYAVGNKDGNEHIFTSWHGSIVKGAWETPSRYTDYDGFCECDFKGKEVPKCKEYTYVTFSLTKWDKVTIRDWWNGREKQIDSFVFKAIRNDKLSAYYPSDPYSAHKLVSDANVVCFVG